MLEYTHAIKDDKGLHARPASALVQTASALSSDVAIVVGGKEVDCRKLIAIMRLGAKHGECVILKVDGENEAADMEVIKKFCISNL